MSDREQLNRLVVLWEDGMITESQRTLLVQLASEFAQLNEASQHLKNQSATLLAVSKNVIRTLEPQS